MFCNFFQVFIFCNFVLLGGDGNAPRIPGADVVASGEAELGNVFKNILQKQEMFGMYLG